MKKVLVLIGFYLFYVVNGLAQGCSVCTNTASQLSDKGARGLNGGILYLALLPFSILVIIGINWWKSNKNTI